MESSARAGRAGPDLFFAWKAAMNIDVRAFAAATSRPPRRRSVSIRSLARSGS